MAYDEGLAQRVRELMDDRAGVAEKKMFGGLAFMVHGNMCFGIVGDEMMLRVGPQGYADALSRPHAREMDFTGRAMKGMVYVAPEGLESDADLRDWIAHALAFIDTLPKK